MIKGQISMFEMLGMDDTPTIPFDQQKEGTKGWVIEIAGLYTTENGFKENMVGVTTVRVILERDSDTDKYGQHQYAHVIEDGCRADGWYGGVEKLYARRPTWRELQDFARAKYPEPWKIVFELKGGDAITRICDFETKKPIHGKEV